MDSIKVKTSAKINLSLDVVGRKPDGYHPVSYTHLDVYKRQLYIAAKSVL